MVMRYKAYSLKLIIQDMALFKFLLVEDIFGQCTGSVPIQYREESDL